MIKPITFSVGSKSALPLNRRIEIADKLLATHGLARLTLQEQEALGYDHVFFNLPAPSPEKAKVLLNHGLLSKGFSDWPVLFNKYKLQAPRKDKSLFPEFFNRSKITFYSTGQGGPCDQPLTWSNGFVDCEAVLLKPAGQPLHLFHFPPWGLLFEETKKLKALPPGDFINILGSQSLPLAASELSKLGHSLIRTVTFPTGIYNWDIYVRQNEGYFYVNQLITQTVFKFLIFPRV